MTAKDRLIFPLDVPDPEEAKRLISLLKDQVGLFKVGYELFLAGGGATFLQFMATEEKVQYFLDLKFHDIPATVRAGLAKITSGAKLATVHIDQGIGQLKASIGTLRDGVKILGVTILTHLGPENLIKMGFDPNLAKSPEKLVLRWARLAREAGCDGVVCAGTEAKAVMQEFGPEFLVVCPAIRPKWARVPGDDQRRISTPYEAIRAGADYIVVGRPIRLASDPKEAARRVVEEIEEALNASGH